MLDGLVQVTLAGEADTVTLLAVEKVVDVGNVG
jgi:hypothetical protein